jgi:hypothetical protein
MEADVMGLRRPSRPELWRRVRNTPLPLTMVRPGERRAMHSGSSSLTDVEEEPDADYDDVRPALAAER